VIPKELGAIQQCPVKILYRMDALLPAATLGESLVEMLKFLR
jgi:hypothetical protein